MTLISQYTLGDIHISVGDHEFKKGRKIFESGKVKNIEENLRGWTAIVEGTNSYSVGVDVKTFEKGFCNCYLGEQDILCKHMIALAIAVTKLSGKDENKYEGQDIDIASCNPEIRELTSDEKIHWKIEIREAMKYIRSYNGPSSTWFTYQKNLQIGARKLLCTCTELPIGKDSVDIIFSILMKLDTKLCIGGVDDSDGCVGDSMEQMVEVLNLMSDLYPDIIPYIKKHLPTGKTWTWEKIYLNR